MGQLESSEVHSSEMLKYQVNNTLVVATNKQPVQYFQSKVLLILRLFCLRFLKKREICISFSYLSTTTINTQQS